MKQLKRAEKLQRLIVTCNEDPLAVDHLSGSIINDGQQYLQNTMPTIISLADKVNKGTYDGRLALNAFDNVAQIGAKKHLSGATPCIRAHTAQRLLEHYQEQITQTAKEIMAKGIKKVREENERVYSQR